MSGRLLASSLALALLPGAASAQCQTADIVGPWLEFGADVAVSDGHILVVSDDFFLSVASVMTLQDGLWVEQTVDTGGGPTIRAGGDLSTQHLLFFPGDQSEQVRTFESFAGTWLPTTPLTAFDGAPGDEFGVSLAVTQEVPFGAYAVIGAPGHDLSSTDAGAAYIFEHVHGAWLTVFKISGAEIDPSARFGDGVAIHGETVLVQAPEEQPAGGLYVFERMNFVWTQTAHLTHPDGRFRGPVEVHGDRFIVGSPLDDTVAVDAGAVHVYEKVAGSWGYSATLTASDGTAGDQLGRSLTMSDDVVVAGRWTAGQGAGSAYVFRFDGSQWVQGVELMGSAVGKMDSLDLEGDLLAAGSPNWARVFAFSMGAECDPGTASCFGVGCPCANDDPAAGCANSTGAGALLGGSGTSSVAADDLVLEVSGLPPGNAGLFYMGDGAGSAGFFDGLQCAQGNTWRFLDSIQDTGAAGEMSFGPGIAASAGGLMVPGTSWGFQAWHRDVAAGASPCGTFANLSNLYTVTVTP